MKQKERIEIPIGEIFIRNGVKYKVVEDEAFGDCICCGFIMGLCGYTHLLCAGKNRSDKKSVHFEKLTKKHK